MMMILMILINWKKRLED